jgi:superkiller protein 3
VAKYPPKAEVLANLGALLARREAFAEAIVHYKSALKVHPSLAPLRLNLGLAYFKSGRFAEAVPEFESYLRAQPAHRQAQQLRAMSLLEIERFAEAAEAFRALLPSADASIALGLATANIRMGRVAEAQQILEPLLAANNDAQVLLTFGQALFSEGRLEDALASFERAMQLNPQLPLVRLHIGSVYWRKKQTAAAIAQWREEYRMAPESFLPVYTLGAALAAGVPPPAEAAALLRKAVRLKPGHAQANYQLAKLLWQTAKSKEAVSYLERATAADPDFREAHYLLATVHQAMGNREAAAREFAAVKRISEKELSRQQDLFSEQP